MSSDQNNKDKQLWNKVKDLGGAYEPRNKAKVRGKKAQQPEYLSPYRRARDEHFRKELGNRYVTHRRRINEIVDSKSKKRYMDRVRRMEEAIAPLKTELWNAFKNENISFLGNGIFWNDDIQWRSQTDGGSAEYAGDDIYDVYNRQKRLEENELPIINTPKELANALDIDIKKLRHLCYHREAATFTHYHAFEVPKKSGGTRQIWAPNKLLKSKQRWVLDQIIHKMPVHGSAHGFVPGCSIYSNAQVHIDSKYIISMDIKDFFPTFTFKRVKGIFRQIGYLDGIATLLTLLCTEAPREEVEYNGTKYLVAVGDRCLPQGSPASPGLTNLACMKLDRRLAGLAKKCGWRYTRYADDITFSTKEGKPKDVESLKAYIEEIVSDEGFVVHQEKTTVMGRGGRQEVTGLVVNNDGDPRTPREVRRMLRAAINNLQQGKLFKEGENIHTLIGYASFIYSTNPEEGQKCLDELASLPEGVGTEAYAAQFSQDSE